MCNKGYKPFPVVEKLRSETVSDYRVNNIHVAATVHKNTDDFALLYLCQVQLGEPLTGIDVILSRVNNFVNNSWSDVHHCS